LPHLFTWFGLDLADDLSGRPRLTASLIEYSSARRAAGPVRICKTAAAPGTAMESANCAPAECWGPPSLDTIVLPPSRENPGGSNMATADIQQERSLAVRGCTAEDANSGGCGIRTREGVNPTRLPSPRTDVLDGPSSAGAAAGVGQHHAVDSDERWQVRLELRLARLRQGRRTVDH
jgi:hypothetical protein